LYKFKEHVPRQITLSIRKKWANKSMNDNRLVYSTEGKEEKGTGKMPTIDTSWALFFSLQRVRV